MSSARTPARSLADDLAHLARLDRLIEQQREITDDRADQYEFSQIDMTGKRSVKPDTEYIASARARWESARRRLRWMHAMRNRFRATVDEALQKAPSPFA